MKRIAVLTSGGDAPGMNPTIRSIVLTAKAHDIEVIGVNRGYVGLMEGDLRPLDVSDVADIVDRSGTILYSARSHEFHTEAGMQKALAVCRENGIEGLVVIGGNGSIMGAKDLSERGLPCVGVTGTIDNDIGCCDYTTGYDTALSTIVDMIDRITDTTRSHWRCAVVEVMGRDAGYLALNGGIAAGATAILIPEVPFDVEKDVIDRIKAAKAKGKNYFVVVVAEGCSKQVESVQALAKRIEAETGVESRATVLGHVQRGGSPTLKDRVVGTRMGNYAVHLLMQGIGNRMVVIQNDEISDMDILEANSITKTLDRSLYDLAMEVSI